MCKSILNDLPQDDKTLIYFPTVQGLYKYVDEIISEENYIDDLPRNVSYFIEWAKDDLQLFNEYADCLIKWVDLDRRWQDQELFYNALLCFKPDCWEKDNRLYEFNRDRDNSVKRYLRDDGSFIREFIEEWNKWNKWNKVEPASVIRPEESNHFVCGKRMHYGRKRINKVFGINDMDMNTYAQNLSTNKHGIFHFLDRYAFKMSSRPDFYNRMTIFAA